MSWLRWLPHLFCWMTWLVLAGAGCNTGDLADAPCQSGFTRCSDQCVDLQTDKTHCGICQRTCQSHEICHNGTCHSACPTSETLCSGRCVSVALDPNHCGTCGTRCPVGQPCSSGKCVGSCSPGFTDCAGSCLDTQNHDKHCGACNTDCAGGKICQSGRCRCPGSLTDCAGTCVDLAKNTSHCGTCNTPCVNYEKCFEGICKIPPVLAIAAGYGYTCALLYDNTMRCWGGNIAGRLGTGDSLDRHQPDPKSIDLGPGRTAKAVSTGDDFHTCALLDNLSLKCWGYNEAGLLGYNDYYNRNKPDPKSIDLGAGRTAKAVSAGYNHTCALLDNNTVKCWGNNEFGQLGTGDNNSRNKPDLKPIDLDPQHPVQAISAGRMYTCALLANHTVKCWGNNTHGQLGTGDNNSRKKPDATPIDFGPSRSVRIISAGRIHTCAILDNDVVSCWGENTYGQLGTNDLTSRNKPDLKSIDLGPERTAKTVSAGYNHTCVILDNDAVKCWGQNTYGQLGTGDNKQRNKPDPKSIDLGAGRTAKAVSAGHTHTCVILDNDAVKCWGQNTYGQLGIGDTTPRNKPDNNPIAF